MIILRKSKERGHANHEWLDSYHTFSFSSYLDRRWMGFSSLRVINEDIVEPGMGFSTHPHEDMEIITYILEGELEHKDSMGTGSVIRPGDIQKMSAGSGITHSEFNPSHKNRVHLLQIWVEPNKTGIKPSYEQIHFTEEQKKNKLLLVASSDASEKVVSITQDAHLFASVMDANFSLEHKLDPKRSYWLHLVRGNLHVNGNELVVGDAMGLQQESLLQLRAKDKAEFLLFDLASE